MTVADSSSSARQAGFRLSSRDGLITIVAIQGIVNFLFTLDSTVRGHPPTWADIPAEVVMFTLVCLLGYGLYLSIRLIDRAPLVVRLLIIFAVCVGLGSLFLPILNNVQLALSPRNPPPLPGPTLARIQVGTVPYLFTAAGLFAVDFYQKVRDAERQLARSQALSREAEALALRYQIDPHFLFNALNSVSTLVLLRQNEEAEEMLLQLSDFFRATLEFGSVEKVTLAQELELQQAYLNVEHARAGDSLELDIAVPAELFEARLPAMILQPLVENAVKHGARDGVISINGQLEDGRLALTVANPVSLEPSSNRPAGTGTGVRNVRQRLAAAYGDSAAFEIDDRQPGRYVTKLTLPFSTT